MLRKIFFLLPLLLIQPALAAGSEGKDRFFKTSDGVRLHYLEAGTGPAIFFEHSCERRAQDIKELIEHLKLDHVVLVGWSLGVPEVLTYAEQYAGSHVRGYVLVDGFAWDKLDPQFIASMMGMYKQVQTNRREFTEKFVRGMYKKPQAEDYIQRVVAASLKMPSDSAVAASVSSISRADWRPALAKVDRPVLVMCQAQLKGMAADPIVSAIPTARVELFEDAGHALFVDDAVRFNALLGNFIQHLPEH